MKRHEAIRWQKLLLLKTGLYENEEHLIRSALNNLYWDVRQHRPDLNLPARIAPIHLVEDPAAENKP